MAQQITPAQSPAPAGREHQIIRIAMLAGISPPNQDTLHQPTLVERDFPFASIGFYVVEFAFVKSLFNVDAICMDMTPAQSQHLTDSERSEHDQHDDSSRIALNLCFDRSRIDFVWDFARQAKQDRSIGAVTTSSKRQGSKQFDPNPDCPIQQSFFAKETSELPGCPHGTYGVRARRANANFEDLKNAGFQRNLLLG